MGFKNLILSRLKRMLSKRKEGGPRTEEEDKVYSWLYSLAQTDRDMVFEYVKSTERGLSFKEAERRLRETGPNIPLDHAFPSWWHILCNSFFHPFNVILLFLSVLSYVTSDYANGCIMLVLVLISVALRFYQEINSSAAAMKLKDLLKSPIKVQRCAGRIVQTELLIQMDQRDIVPGDIISFGPGDLFPGDVRLLRTKELVVSQSSLTGESGTMEKVANIKEDLSTPLLELRNICFMGTSVVSGSGVGLVVSTGSKTYMSTIFSTLGKQKIPNEFNDGVRHVSYALVLGMIVIVPIIVLAVYLAAHTMSQSIIYGISVAVALTPQMLPIIVNTTLAKGALAMARDKCIVKNLDVIQNMGSMDILCIDKTGTLTMDRAIMIHHLNSRGLPEQKVLKFAFLNSYFKSELKNPVDDAILGYVYTSGYRFEPSKWKKIDEIPFDFIRKRVSVLIETDINPRNGCYGDVQRLLVTKGALEEVLKICRFIEHFETGLVLPISVEDCERILQIGDELNNDGMRVLGLAIRKMKKEVATVDKEMAEANMMFMGMISFYDPPKDSAKQALCRLATKGVEAKVLTGDSLPLAVRICKEVGIGTTNVITGPELELLDHDSFHDTIRHATVLARLTPAQKRHVVQILQTQGKHIVGFLGDGINDSLALDKANVGISVDSGANVAKDLADIILLEKDLNVLAAGVEHGRITHVNTMKYLKMSMVANFGSIVSLLTATFCLPFEPLTPGQLLMQNFLYTLGQIAIPWDKIEESYIRFPQHWSSRSLPLFMIWNGLVCSVCDIGNFLVLRFYFEAHKTSEFEFFRSAWFVEGLLIQTLIIHLIRTEKFSFIQERASWQVISSTVIVSSIGIAIPFSPIGKAMGLSELPLAYFGFLTILFLGYFVLAHLVKRMYIQRYGGWL